MDTKLTKWIIWFCHLLYELQKAHCTFVIRTQMPWVDGFSRCHLANKMDVEQHIEYYKAWVGALSVHTPWMVHEGCFKYTMTTDKTRRFFDDNSPSRCSYFCRTYRYFSLMGILCRCADEIHPVPKTFNFWCSSPCPGTIEDSCGSPDSTYVNLFRHIRGEYIPRHSAENKYCSVLMVSNNDFHIEAEECWKQHNGICDRNVITAKTTFNTAKQNCDLKSNFDSDVISKYSLTDGIYWTGIYRIERIRWLEGETLHDICNELGSLDTLKCIVVQYKSRINILKTPVSCMEWFPVLCSDNKEVAFNNSVAACNKKSVPETTTEEASSMSNVYLDLTQTDRVTYKHTTEEASSMSNTYLDLTWTDKATYKHTTTQTGKYTDMQADVTTTSYEEYSSQQIYKRTYISTRIIAIQNPTTDAIRLQTKPSNGSLPSKGESSVHLFLKISVLCFIAMFIVGMSVISLLIAYFKRRLSNSSVITSDNQYLDLQRTDYDHLQTRASDPITLFAESKEVEGQYVEIK